MGLASSIESTPLSCCPLEAEGRQSGPAQPPIGASVQR